MDTKQCFEYLWLVLKIALKEAAHIISCGIWTRFEVALTIIQLPILVKGVLTAEDGKHNVTPDYFLTIW